MVFSFFSEQVVFFVVVFFSFLSRTTVIPDNIVSGCFDSFLVNLPFCRDEVGLFSPTDADGPPYTGEQLEGCPV